MPIGIKIPGVKPFTEEVNRKRFLKLKINSIQTY